MSISSLETGVVGGEGAGRLHLTSAFHQQPSVMTGSAFSFVLAIWPEFQDRSVPFQNLHRNCRGKKPRLPFLKKSAVFHIHLGQMFVFHGGRCLCFQSKRLCERTQIGGVRGEQTLSPVFPQAGTALVVQDSRPSSVYGLA